MVRGAYIVVPSALGEKVVQLAPLHPRGYNNKRVPQNQGLVPRFGPNGGSIIQHCHLCQVVTPSYEREPLQMTPLPSEPWKEVAMDFWGPINMGEYLLAVVYKQSKWAEVEFVSDTSARAVILKLDRVFSSLGIPVSVDSDNRPPFSGQEFQDFSKYLGFKHERKTPQNPQATEEDEQFMRVLKKLYQICMLTGQNFKQEVHRFLRCYRATPHCTTKLALAEL